MNSKFDKYIELDFDFTDDNNVTFVDGHTTKENGGKVLGYIVNSEFYPTDPDILLDNNMMAIINEHIAEEKRYIRNII